MVCSFGAASKKLAGVEITCSSGNRLLDYAISVCGHSVEWPVQWKSHVALEIRINTARTLPMNIACIPKGIPQNRCQKHVEWNERRRNHAAPDEEHQTAARKQYSKVLWIHQDTGLAEAGEGVGAPYHRSWRPHRKNKWDRLRQLWRRKRHHAQELHSTESAMHQEVNPELGRDWQTKSKRSSS